MTVTSLRLVSFCLALVALALSAAAQETQLSFGALRADPDLPVEVTAATLDVDQETGEAVFRGDVVVIHGEMRLSGDEVVVVYDEESAGIARLEARGKVILVNGDEAAEADDARYDVESGLVFLTGNVLLTQGRTTLSSERMTVDLNAGTAQMSGRVRTILQPEN